MRKETIDSIGFDLDGTLWDGTASIAAAWQLCMNDMPHMCTAPMPEDLKKVMGLPISEILVQMFPDLTPEQRLDFMERRRLAEADYITAHGGKLFEPIAVLKDAFAKLSAKYRLFIVSNCQEGYIEAFLAHYGLQKYFCDIECWGATGLSKGKNIRLVMERNGLKNAIYVGDTQGDCDAACEAGVPFVLASYGFGQVNGAVKSIKSISQLCEELCD